MDELLLLMEGIVEICIYCTGCLENKYCWRPSLSYPCVIVVDLSNFAGRDSSNTNWGVGRNDTKMIKDLLVQLNSNQLFRQKIREVIISMAILYVTNKEKRENVFVTFHLSKSNLDTNWHFIWLTNEVAVCRQMKREWITPRKILIASRTCTCFSLE